MAKENIIETEMPRMLATSDQMKDYENEITADAGFTRSHLFALLENDLKKEPIMIGPEQSILFIDSFRQFVNLFGHFGGAAYHGLKPCIDGEIRCEDCVGFGEHGLVVVADGIGSLMSSDVAAQIVVGAFIECPLDFGAAAAKAIKELKEYAQKISAPRMGAAFLAYRPVWSRGAVRLKVFQGGDVKLMIHNEKGRLIWTSNDNTSANDLWVKRGKLRPRDLYQMNYEDEARYGVHNLTRALTSETKLEHLLDYETECEIKPGYRVTVVSDSFGENLAAEVDLQRSGDEFYNFDDFWPAVESSATMYDLFELLGEFADAVSFVLKGYELERELIDKLDGVWPNGLVKKYLKLDHTACTHHVFFKGRDFERLVEHLRNSAD